MDRNTVGSALLPLIRRMPHWKLSLPCIYDRRITLTFYIDSEIGLWLGYNEPKVIDWWKSKDMKHSVIFDVGAHIGIYSLLAAANGARVVHAFEPDPKSASRIEIQSKENKLNTIQVNECVVGDRVGKVELHLSDNGRQHSLREKRGEGESKQVKSTTIDALEAEPDLVKVDVEGAADQVINGATKTIEQGRTTWLIELHNSRELEAVQTSFNEYQEKEIDERHIVLEPE
ncbi:FkbM family methyltransferase [Halopenitus persicus]|uniref:Methyltransferase, FkbM family n=1 Tax=Halopenitus persicus TaxID=1048396 RepID=A0A1H3P6B4_9EURY|nr:FkbM family methyltransferase [Halopenitus persicus]SDY96580.1 methyltransferase, FkbM family [Halopenitus persicus]